MDLLTEITLLTVASTVAMVAGIAMILFGGPTLATVGIVLVTVGGIVFIFDARDILVEEEQVERE